MAYLRLRARRQLWRRRGPVSAALRELWDSPLPRPRARLQDVDFLVCDAEMSGLDPRKAELLSLGWVRIEGGEVQLSSARHHLLSKTRGVGHSATVHRLRDCDFDRARDASAVLFDLLRAASGCVLVFHHAQLDLAFLNRAFKALARGPLLVPVVDTLRLEQRLLARRDRVIVEGDLRLQACRERYGLPAFTAHSAQHDALAAAELLLAHAARRGGDLRLRDLF